MNDDDLYRLREAPPPALAFRLRARLARVERARRVRTGLLGFFCGVAAVAAVLSPVLRHPGGADRVASRSAPLQTPAAVRASSPGTPASVSAPPASPAGPAQTPAATLSGRRPEASVSSTGAQPTGAAPAVAGAAAAAVVRVDTGTAGEAADAGPGEAVAVRRGLFRVMGWLERRDIAMLTGARPFDADRMRQDSLHLGELSRMMGDAFATNTSGFVRDTRARPEIWAQLPDFLARADRLTAAAQEAAVAARTGERDLALPALQKLARACSDCHARYRMPEEPAPR